MAIHAFMTNRTLEVYCVSISNYYGEIGTGETTIAVRKWKGGWKPLVWRSGAAKRLKKNKKKYCEILRQVMGNEQQRSAGSQPTPDQQNAAILDLIDALSTPDRVREFLNTFRNLQPNQRQYAERRLQRLEDEQRARQQINQSTTRYRNTTNRSRRKERMGTVVEKMGLWSVWELGEFFC